MGTRALLGMLAHVSSPSQNCSRRAWLWPFQRWGDRGPGKLVLVPWIPPITQGLLFFSSSYIHFVFHASKPPWPELSPQCKGGQLISLPPGRLYLVRSCDKVLLNSCWDTEWQWLRLAEAFLISTFGRAGATVAFPQEIKINTFGETKPRGRNSLSPGTLQEIRNSPWVWLWNGDRENL